MRDIFWGLSDSGAEHKYQRRMYRGYETVASGPPFFRDAV